MFGYFVAFRYGLTFLLSVGKGRDVTPGITVTDYFDKFVNVILGVGIAFELPVLIMLLVLLRIATPRLLLAHSRYAVLAIVTVAAVITPTTDPFNLMLVAGPLCALYFLGVGAGYLVTLRRDGRGMSKRAAAFGAGGAVVLAAGYYWLVRPRYPLSPHWPFLVRQCGRERRPGGDGAGVSAPVVRPRFPEYRRRRAGNNRRTLPLPGEARRQVWGGDYARSARTFSAWPLALTLL